MANYSDIKGFTVQTLSSDTAASRIDTGSWASTTPINTARHSIGGAGTRTQSIMFGGYDAPAAQAKALTESWNGSSWTEVADLNTTRSSCGAAGTYTSAIAMASSPPPNRAKAETWDGSSWTEVADLNTPRHDLNGGAGPNASSAMTAGGSSPNLAIAEVWNGSSWTEVGDLNTGRRNPTVSGVATSALASGGLISPNRQSITESWNGSSWTEVADLNTARNSAAGAGTDNTAGLLFGGNTAPGNTTTANTEFFDGSSWTEVNNLATPRMSSGSAGTTTSAIMAGGTPGNKSDVEEWTTTPADEFVQIHEGQLFFNSTANAFKETITDIPGATWASSGALNTPRGNAGASGLQTAALYFGGDGPPGPAIANTEQYDGSSWTEVNDLNVARGQQFFSNQGTQTAALSATGSPIATNVESWNGSTWTETTDLNTGRRNGASLGTQGAMLGTGGYASPSYRTLTEIWDGSSWTETGDCPDAKFVSRGGGGTTTAGIIAGNYPNGDVDSSQTWDGTSWTNGPNINTGRSGIAFSATSQSSALGHGGGTGTPQAAQTKTEFFNGTSWTELNDLATASQQGGGAGSSILGIHYGGYGPGALTTTEEWTAGLGNKTITSS
jgi:hypothetical protein